MSSNTVKWPKAYRPEFEVSDRAVYCGAMGFEERALAFLEKVSSARQRLDAVVAIEYSPYDKENRKHEFLELAKRVTSSVQIIHYDRFAPEEFEEKIPETFREFEGKQLIIDISGLSKLGIVILTQGLARCAVRLSVFYSEAEVYHPTRDEFEQQRKGLPVDDMPEFLTTKVHDIIGTTSLSSVSMPGAPIALVAFPTFNHIELRALLNEVTPQRLFLLRGMPPDPSNRWRFDAVNELNGGVTQHIDGAHTVSTLDYVETVGALETFYADTRYTHRLVVAPTGSKMQSLGVSLFKQIHPDIQVIYPVAEGFVQEYTRGSINHWQIDFEDFQVFCSELQSLRKKALLELTSKLNNEPREK